jgi:hypothetical protein
MSHTPNTSTLRKTLLPQTHVSHTTTCTPLFPTCELPPNIFLPASKTFHSIPKCKNFEIFSPAAKQNAHVGEEQGLGLASPAVLCRPTMLGNAARPPWTALVGGNAQRAPNTTTVCVPKVRRRCKIFQVEESYVVTWKRIHAYLSRQKEGC